MLEESIDNNNTHEPKTAEVTLGQTSLPDKRNSHDTDLIEIKKIGPYQGFPDKIIFPNTKYSK